MTRPSGRAPGALRTVSIQPGVARHAEGSCVIRMGLTEVLCTASVEGKVPPFLRGQGQGWVTAAYGMLPRATHTPTMLTPGLPSAAGLDSRSAQILRELVETYVATGEPVGSRTLSRR
ncbi:MAG: hypothetical protein INF72_09245, partial [Roseomonas sp.]|nr:hypothetical protein [Roseomonas sp.]